MRVLLESAGRGERLAAFGTSVSAGTDVIGADVALQIGWVAEDFRTVLARIAPPETVLHDRVPRQ